MAGSFWDTILAQKGIPQQPQQTLGSNQSWNEFGTGGGGSSMIDPSIWQQKIMAGPGANQNKAYGDAPVKDLLNAYQNRGATGNGTDPSMARTNGYDIVPYMGGNFAINKAGVPNMGASQHNESPYDIYDAQGNYLSSNTWHDMGTDKMDSIVDPLVKTLTKMFIAYGAGGMMGGEGAGMGTGGFEGYGVDAGMGAGQGIGYVGGTPSTFGVVDQTVGLNPWQNLGGFEGYGAPSGIGSGVGFQGGTPNSFGVTDPSVTHTPGYTHPGFQSAPTPPTGTPAPATSPKTPTGGGGLSSMLNTIGGKAATGLGGVITALAGGGGKGGEGLGSLIPGIVDANQQGAASDKMLQWMNENMAKIDNLYKPGSKEYDALWNEMSRKDAAAGRNSQYGPRSVDLAGRIAQIKAENTTRLASGLSKPYADALNQNASKYSGLMAGMGNGGANSLATVLNSLFRSGKVGGDSGMSNADIWDQINGGGSINVDEWWN